MIFSKIWKRDPKGFVIQSDITKMFYFNKFVKIIKFKVFVTTEGKEYLVFIKYKNKILQKTYSGNIFEKLSGDNLKICKYFLKEARPILAYKGTRKIAKRYLSKFYPEELL